MSVECDTHGTDMFSVGGGWPPDYWCPLCEVETLRVDKARLDWFEEQFGLALVNDDDGRWVVAKSVMWNLPDDGPYDMAATLFIEKRFSRWSVREVLDEAMAYEENIAPAPEQEE